MPSRRLHRLSAPIAGVVARCGRLGVVATVATTMILAATFAPNSASAGTSSVPPTSVPPVTGPPSNGPDLGGPASNGPASATALTVPLLPVPNGCTAPPLPLIVFAGTVVGGDYRSTRFQIDQIRFAQSKAQGFIRDDQIDVRYGLDTQYLKEGETYLVGASVDPALGLLFSKVTPIVEDFGGDEVIGLSETDADCVEFEDPAQTLHPDGTPIEGGVLKPLSTARSSLALAIVLPLLVALGVVFVLAALRTGSRAAANAVNSGEYRP